MLKDNLSLLRNIRGFSQEEIADQIGVSRQAYAKWESGSTVPDIIKCARLAEIYGITIDSLIKTEQVEGIGSLPPAPIGKCIWGTVVINERGQLVIPKALRDQFKITAGQRLVLLSDEEGIAMIPAEYFEAKIKRIWELASKPSSD